MIKFDIKAPVKYTERELKNRISEALPILPSEISDVKIIKRSLDLKNKGKIEYKMTVAIELSPEREAGLLKMRKKVSSYENEVLTIKKSSISLPPVVVGSGPAGLFAALVLAESGANPVIIERGLPVEEREKKVKAFVSSGVLDTECNIQYGEGGAGTYSDGKLKVGGMDKYKRKILDEFVLAGANDEITFSDTAHLGTDKLSGIVKNIREKIKGLGGKFIFSARLCEIKIKSGKVVAAVYQKDGAENVIPTENIILAAGHSARDTFEMLEVMGVPMEKKGFGIGVRIEHGREYINNLIYGKDAPCGIETASYRFVTHLPSGRSVYSFCMCPGGTVVPAASEHGGIVTNGMSVYNRDGENSNAAFLVSVTPNDFEDDSILAGLDLQRKIEKCAYGITNSYKAPSESLESFYKKLPPSASKSLNPTYPIGVENIKTEDYLPKFITDSLREAVVDFDKWIPGFYYPDAIITGPETRSTSPIRILRNEIYEALGFRGLYPAGEGAGYSGGIVSSALDGIKCAEALINKNIEQ